MSQVTCSPHTLPPGAGETGLCRTCNALVGNPANAAAVAKGLVNANGTPRSINQHNANPGSTVPKNR